MMLRLKNFTAALRDAAELEEIKITLKPRKPGVARKVKIKDLRQFKWSWSDGARLVPDFEFAKLPKKISHSFGHNLIDRYIDSAGQYYYELGSIPHLQVQAQVLMLTAPDGATFIVSEAEFNRLLFSLLPRLLADFFGDRPAEHRYRLEALVRDFQLATAAQTLRGQSDKTLEELYKRLKANLSDITASHNRDRQMFLSSHIRVRGSRALQDGPLSNLLWSGWGEHPAYWLTRARAASRLQNPWLPGDETDGDLPTPASPRKRARLAKKEENNQVLRTSPESTKRKTLGKKGARMAAIAMGLFAAYHFGPQVPSLPDLPNMKFEMPSIPRPELPSVQLPFDLNLDLLRRLLGGMGLDRMDFNSWPKADNYRIPSPSDAGGGRKKLTDKHNPFNSDYAIEILMRRDGTPTPKYYNFATASHLKPEGRGRYGVSRQARELHQEVRAKPDMVIDVNLRSYSMDRKVGVLQISGYKIMKWEMYDGWGRRIDDSLVRVFEIPGNRQTYADLNPSVGWGPYTYRASYKVDSRYDQKFDPQLSRATVDNISERLNVAGFKTLSLSIRRSLGNGFGLTLNGMSQAFQEGATYTKDGIKWSVNYKAEEAFRPFTAFLNQGQLYYQCTGSNMLYQTTMTEAIKLEPSLQGVQMQHLIGYGGGDQAGVPKGSPSHLHSVAYKIEADGRGEQFAELEAQPPVQETTAPPKPKVPENPAPPTDSERWWAILPERPRYHVPEMAVEDDKPEAPPKEEEPPPPAKKQSNKMARQKVEQVERILTILKNTRTATVDGLKPVYESESWLARQNFLQIPGLRLIVLSQFVLEGFSGKGGASDLLARLKASGVLMNAADAEAELNRFFAKELESLNQSLTNLDVLTESEKYQAYAFLTQDPLRSFLRELSQMLGHQNWGTLLREYREAQAILSLCEDKLLADKH